jgi:DNA-binding NarL/FixJ family response regulator
MNDESPEALPVRVLVADSTRMGSELLASALSHDSRFEVVGAFTIAEAWSLCVSAMRPDMAVVGTTADSHEGCALIRRLRAQAPKLSVVMLLEAAGDKVVVEAFRAGAHGVVDRDASADILLKCVYSVYQGQIWASSEQLRLVLNVICRESLQQAALAEKYSDRLSKRELEIVRAVTRGFNNPEIAANLGVSQHTVKNHLFRIFNKVGVSSRAEIILSLSRMRGASSAV